MAPKKLAALPAARVAEFPAIRDRWLKVGLQTGPGDREKAWAGIKTAYTNAGRPAPALWLWMRSPLEQVYACALLRARASTSNGAQVLAQVSAQVLAQVSAQVLAQVSAQVRDQVLAQVSAQVRDQVLAQVSDQVRAQVSDQVRAQVLAQVSDQVRDQVLAQVSDQVRAQVSDQVRDQVLAQVSDQVLAQVRDQVSDQVRDQVSDPAEREALARLAWHSSWWMPGGWGTSYWLAWLEALREHCDFERVAPLVAVAESCASAWTFPDIVVFCQPPVWIRRDEQNRLHSEDGPAVLFADGYGVWAWHGIRVPQRVIEQPEAITVQEALAERNAEIRRIMLMRIGPERMEREGALEVVDEVDDDQVEIGSGRDGLPVPIGLRGGRLLRRPATDDMPAMQWVSLNNSTPEPDGSIKRYFLRVPPTAKTVRGAVAWTFDVPVKQYQPVLES